MGTVTDSSFWSSFADVSDFEEITCEGQGSLAVRVLEQYGIRNRNDRGGELINLDVAHMDAMQVIKMSLLEDSVDNIRAPYEAYINYIDNSVEFKEVGAYSGSVTDIYYTIQTSSYIEDCSGVMVTAGVPLVERKQTSWRPIWGEALEYREIYDTTDMASNCNKSNFVSHVTIAYRDPHLQTDYEDGIDNIYEIDASNPHDELIGYAVRKYSTYEGVDEDVTISDITQCSIPIKLPDDNLGTLVKRPAVDTDSVDDPACWAELAAAPANVVDNGILVPIPPLFRFTTFHGDKQDHFIRVSQVYAIGQDLDLCNGKPKTNKDGLVASTPENTEIWVSMKNTEARVINLQEGVEYVIGYEEDADPKDPYIVFANNSKDYDNATYGAQVTYSIYPTCEYGQVKVAAGKENELRNQTGNILPIGGNAGILVHQIWAVVDIETPGVVIHDPKGYALEIARDLQYSLYPLVIVKEPAPIGFNGRVIDQSIRGDNDPTTQQDLTDTDYEQAIDEMEAGGGMSLNLSFLDEEGARKLSEVLYNYMNGQDGVETVYTCGPNCDPKLGGEGNAGGIINSITHQYSDSGSYTISCTEGGRLMGNFAEVTGGPYVKAVENPSIPGTVVQDMGNHIFFKVRLDGFGEKIAVNTSSSVIRSNDRVMCSIHNNPVEL